MAKASSGGQGAKPGENSGYGYRFSQTMDEKELRGPNDMAAVYSRYRSVVRDELVKEFGYANPHRVPSVSKIVLNIGMGEAIKTPKYLEQSFECLGNISGQRPVVTRARKSIATFKLREGMKIGCMVTLRRRRMWDFLDRLLTVALPRTRDFRGLSRKAFDGRGNYTVGVKEALIFLEVDMDKLDKVPGMNICIHTSARTDQEGRALLKHLGMPFRAA